MCGLRLELIVFHLEKNQKVLLGHLYSSQYYHYHHHLNVDYIVVRKENDWFFSVISN